MRLISLTIQGFKSFADRTIIEFNPGVTAIVGPNGSGKSNVTDAIRWVMGEQSVRSLRGKRMEDIIFSGTSTRKAMGFAEVTMTIDNSDGLLPVEFAEVAVSRRLYRSGESSYLINKQQVRLKDINSLFMDTGLGSDGYSIIGQGKVDEILSTRSEDRRRIFEEAAGIQKYKTRYNEAMRKLEHTEQNLTRVTDILTELNAQQGPLEKQAETATTYLEKQGELRELDIADLLWEIERDDARSLELKTELEQLGADLQVAEQNQTALEAGRARAGGRLAELDALRQELSGHKDSLNDELTRLSQDAGRLDERRSQLQTRLQEQDSSSLLAQSNLAELQAELGRQDDACQAASALRDKSRQLTAERQSDLDEQVRQQSDLRGKQQLLRRQLEENRDNRSRLYSEQLRQEGQAEQLALQASELSSRRTDAQNALAVQQESYREQLQEAERLESTLTQTAQDLAIANDKVALIEQQLNEMQDEQQAMEQSIRNATYQLDTLRNLERNLTGYAEPVRQILRRGQSDSRYSGGIRGTLGSLIETDAEHELAIETALGASVQQIVVTDEQVASGLIEILKQERLGRATFLPIATIRPRELGEDERQQLERYRGRGGFIGSASELVTCPEEVRDVVDNILGRIVIVDDLDHAISMARDFRHRLRFVTLEGDVINPGGSLTGGYNKKRNGGLISRSREITELEKQLNSDHRTAASLDSRRSGLEQERSGLMDSADQLAAEHRDLQQLVVREEARLGAMSERTAELQQRLANLATEGDTLKANLSAAQAGSASHTSEINELDKAILTLQEQLNEQEALEADGAGVQTALRDRLAAAQSELANAEAEVLAATRVRDRVSGDVQRAQREMDNGVDLKARFQQQIKALEQEWETLGQQQTDTRDQLRQTDEQLKTADEDRNQAAERSEAVWRDLQLNLETLNALKRRQDNAQAQLERLEQQSDSARNRLWEDYELTPGNAGEYRQEDWDHSSARSRIQKLRQAIRDLGPVNVAAIEDYERISERCRFLEKQSADIRSTQEQLNTLITDLLQEMRQQFSENFELIRTYFKETFSELFGGGEADIVLEEGVDILESSIDIKASPPGKHLQNMMLLSGGERSLTAIALLFAFLKLRSSPFCVLDEIEAALDDSNTFRFTDYVRNYSDKTQFILVTHRKTTMEAADTIYGVTMQERGVSRILSMALN